MTSVLSIKYTQLINDSGICKQAERMKARSLRHAAGAIRLTAKRSIKTPGKRMVAKSIKEGKSVISKPGQPALSHEGSYKKSIFYGLDTAMNSAVIGPSTDFGTDKDVPGLLEFGGHKRTKRGRTLKYRARPLMRPALRKITPKFSQYFANAFGGTV